MRTIDAMRKAATDRNRRGDARSLVGPAARHMSASTEILLTSVVLATGVAVILFGAPLLPVAAGTIGAGLLRFAVSRARRRAIQSDITTQDSRSDGRESGLLPGSGGR